MEMVTKFNLNYAFTYFRLLRLTMLSLKVPAWVSTAQNKLKTRRNETGLGLLLFRSDYYLAQVSQTTTESPSSLWPLLHPQLEEKSSKSLKAPSFREINHLMRCQLAILFQSSGVVSARRLLPQPTVNPFLKLMFPFTLGVKAGWMDCLIWTVLSMYKKSLISSVITLRGPGCSRSWCHSCQWSTICVWPAFLTTKSMALHMYIALLDQSVEACNSFWPEAEACTFSWLGSCITGHFSSRTWQLVLMLVSIYKFRII